MKRLFAGAARRSGRAKSKFRSDGRRAFLRGAGGIAIALPFLESFPRGTAHAQESELPFALFIGTGNGVIADKWWPLLEGPLDELSGDPNAAGILAEFASDLLFVGGTRYPGNITGCTHSSSYSQMYTGATPEGSGNQIMATAPSIDNIIAPTLNPEGLESLCLYSGMKTGYIDERLSFRAAGELRAAEGNPYVVYQDMLTAAGLSPDEGASTLDELSVRRKSAIDLVRDELDTMLSRRVLGQADQERLNMHLESLRAIELRMEGMGAGPVAGCDTTLLDDLALTSANETYRKNGMVEEIAMLQFDLIAFAFACGLNHVVTLQIGDGLDQTVYDVPSNARGWNFHHISHQLQSDAGAGMDEVAVAAHTEIDRLRMQTFLYGLRRFQDYGLLDKTLIMWANQFSDGRSGSGINLPVILAGNPGGKLASGQYLQLQTTNNANLLTTVAGVLGHVELIGEANGETPEILA